MFKNKFKFNAVILLLVFVGGITSSFINEKILEQEDASILGSWQSEEDSNFRIIFNGNTCTWTYTNEPSQTFNFTLSNSSPQCGESVLVNNQTKYLHLVSAIDSSDEICYEIYSLTNTTLTLRVIDSSGFLIFNRQ
ncbi:hypothetical protein [Flavobacterium sp.]|jgi:hypothetical protein|uniref:hypothetical protein n=1 Tax=Flavobacterium sp. TaxID=239 RepID=UPI0022BD15D5|nr:hypothetical protein [Flavobacterium sp.]MCZ8089720.1 hypothetical protein [Flavobacterium sp.]